MASLANNTKNATTLASATPCGEAWRGVYTTRSCDVRQSFTSRGILNERIMWADPPKPETQRASAWQGEQTQAAAGLSG
jgi:hypothetical protein